MKRRRGEREIKGKKGLIIKGKRERGRPRGRRKKGGVQAQEMSGEWREWGVENHNQELEGKARSR